MNKKFIVNEKEIKGGPLYIDIITNKNELKIKKIEIKDKIHIIGAIKKISARIFFQGELTFISKLTCSLCGKEFQKAIKEKIYTEYIKSLPSLKEKPLKLKVDELDVEYYNGDFFSIESSIHDTAILAIPFAPKCKEDCKGLCPVCGANLNKVNCGCKVEKYNPLKETVLKLKK